MDFLKVTELNLDSFSAIIRNAVKTKKNPAYLGTPLKGKHIGIFFEKPSTRTRISFEVAIHHLGGEVIHLNANELQISRGESIEDTAKVLSRYLDGLVIRTFSHKFLEDFARFADIPVINALSDLYHPCQSLADFMTIYEVSGRLNNLKICYSGDGDNNVAHSLILASGVTKNEIIVASPSGYAPSEEIIQEARNLGGKVTIENRLDGSCLEVDAAYTDVWVSMGKEKESSIRKKKLKPFQLNHAYLEKCTKKPIIMHCLPANKGEEITEEVFNSPYSRVIDQAENRLHTQKALLHYLYSQYKR